MFGAHILIGAALVPTAVGASVFFRWHDPYTQDRLLVVSALGPPRVTVSGRFGAKSVALRFDTAGPSSATVLSLPDGPKRESRHLVLVQMIPPAGRLGRLLVLYHNGGRIRVFKVRPCIWLPAYYDSWNSTITYETFSYEGYTTHLLRYKLDLQKSRLRLVSSKLTHWKAGSR